MSVESVVQFPSTLYTVLQKPTPKNIEWNVISSFPLPNNNDRSPRRNEHYNNNIANGSHTICVGRS